MQPVGQLFRQVRVDVDLLLGPGAHVKVALAGAAVGIGGQRRVAADGVVQQEIQFIFAITDADIVKQAVDVAPDTAGHAEIGVVAIEERGKACGQAAQTRFTQGPEM